MTRSKVLRLRITNSLFCWKLTTENNQLDVRLSCCREIPADLFGLWYLPQIFLVPNPNKDKEALDESNRLSHEDYSRALD
jgi:hypothetical protein